MGEIADMMLDGILDANGEYTGINPGHPVYPKGWFGGQKSSDHHKHMVNNFLKQRGIIDESERFAIVNEYAKTIDRKNKRVFRYIQGNFKAFKDFVDKRIGYVKPSKKENKKPPMGHFDETHYGV